MKKTIFMVVISFFIVNLFCAELVFAQDIKARMRERLPVLNALKAKGVIGENNKGFLEFRGNKEKVNIVTAENHDRSNVYSAIARQQKTTPDLVGKRRALKIQQIARPGDWLQNASGKWYKK